MKFSRRYFCCSNETLRQTERSQSVRETSSKIERTIFSIVSGDRRFKILKFIEMFYRIGLSFWPRFFSKFWRSSLIRISFRFSRSKSDDRTKKWRNRDRFFGTNSRLAVKNKSGRRFGSNSPFAPTLQRERSTNNSTWKSLSNLSKWNRKFDSEKPLCTK